MASFVTLVHSATSDAFRHRQYYKQAPVTGTKAGMTRYCLEAIAAESCRDRSSCLRGPSLSQLRGTPSCSLA